MGKAVRPHHASERIKKRKFHGQKTAAQLLFFFGNPVKKPCHGSGGPAVSASPVIGAVEAALILVPDMAEQPCLGIAQESVIALHLFHGLLHVPGRRQKGREHVAGIRPNLFFLQDVTYHAAGSPGRLVQGPVKEPVQRSFK